LIFTLFSQLYKVETRYATSHWGSVGE